MMVEFYSLTRLLIVDLYEIDIKCCILWSDGYLTWWGDYLHGTLPFLYLNEWVPLWKLMLHSFLPMMPLFSIFGYEWNVPCLLGHSMLPIKLWGSFHGHTWWRLVSHELVFEWGSVLICFESEEFARTCHLWGLS